MRLITRLLLWLTIIVAAQATWYDRIVAYSHGVELSLRGEFGLFWLMGIVPIFFLSICVCLLIEVLVSLFAHRK